MEVPLLEILDSSERPGPAQRHQGTFRGNAGLVHKTSETTATQLRILRALGLAPPPTFPALSLAA